MKVTANSLSAITSVTLLSTALVACGGGGDGGSDNSSTNVASTSQQTSTSDNDAESTNAIDSNTQGQTKQNNQVENKVNADSQIGDQNAAIDQPQAGADSSQTGQKIDPDNNLNGVNQSALLVHNELNSRRAACGFGALTHNDQLQNTAHNHANYLLYMNKNSRQYFQGHNEMTVGNFSGTNNPFFTGHFVAQRMMPDSTKIGSQAKMAHYDYQGVSENLSYLKYSQKYLTNHSDDKIAKNLLLGLLAAPYHMVGLLSPNFVDVGIYYGRDTSATPMKPTPYSSTVPAFDSVLEFVSGSKRGDRLPKQLPLIHYPCQDVGLTEYKLTNEHPSPLPNRNLANNPVGQPIYVLADTPITMVSYQLTNQAGTSIKLKELNQNNDPNQELGNNQVMLIPMRALKPSHTYHVRYTVRRDNGEQVTQSFDFSTKAA